MLGHEVPNGDCVQRLGEDSIIGRLIQVCCDDLFPLTVVESGIIEAKRVSASLRFRYLKKQRSQRGASLSGRTRGGKNQFQLVEMAFEGKQISRSEQNEFQLVESVVLGRSAGNGKRAQTIQQQRPAESDVICSPPSICFLHQTTKQIIPPSLGRNAYRSFNKTVELRQVVRQQGESQAAFREVLATLRVNEPTVDHWRLLYSRIWTALPDDEVARFDGALRIFPVNERVREYNT